MNSISKGGFFVIVDKASDYLPCVSTVSNLIDLFQKCVVLPFMDKQTIANNHYYTYLKEKTVGRCFILLIPGIGNIIIQYYDYRELNSIRRNPLDLQFASERLKNDLTIVLEAVRRNGIALQFASEGLKNDLTVVLEAVRQNGMALQFASEGLKNDQTAVLVAVRRNGMALQFASERLKNNQTVVLEAVRQNGMALQFASEDL